MSVNAIQAPIVRAAGIGAPPQTSVAQALAAFRSNSITTPVNITDTVSNIKNNFDFLTQLGNKLGSLKLSDGNNQGNSLSLTSSQYTSGSSVLNNIKSAFSLKVTNVSTDDLNSVLSNVKVIKVEVADTTAKIGLNFDRLLAQPNKVDKVTQTGALTDISITEAQRTSANNLGMLAKIKDSNNANNYSLALTNVKAGTATALVTNAANKVSSVDVKDTAANIAAKVGELATITPAKLLGISQSDAASSIQLDYTTYNSNKTGVLTKLAGNSNLTVTNVKADQATVDAVNADAKVKGISITDTAQAVLDGKIHNNGLAKVTATNVVDTSTNISAKFGTTNTLLAGMSGLTKVTIKDTGTAGALNITEDQFKNNTALLGKLYVDGNANKNAYTLTVKDVIAGDAATLAKTATITHITVKSSISEALSSFTALSSNTKVNQIDLTGSSADIGTNIDAMDKLGAKLNTITNSSAGTDISVTYDQFVKRSATLAKIDTYGLNVTDASASAAKNLATDNTRHVNHLTVKDSGANISTAFTDLKDTVAGSKLTKIVQSDTAEIKLTAAQKTLAAGVLGVLKDASGTTTNFKLHITEALAANVSTLSAANNVTKVSIKDTSANISTSIGLLTSVSQAGELGDVYQTGTQANIGITATQLANANTKGVLEKVYDTNNVKGNYTLDVTGVLAADAKALETANSKVAKITISDTAANLASNLATVSTINASKLKSLTVTGGDIDVQASNLVSYNTSVFSKIDGGSYTLNVLDASATQAKTLTSTNTKIAHLTVSDSGTSVAAKWGDLNDLVTATKLTKITLSDADTPLVLTDAQYNNGQASSLGNTLNQGNYKLSISGVSAGDAADSTKSVNTDGNVVSMSVKDTGANIATNLSSLNDLGGKLLSINWTDTKDGGGADQIMATIAASDYQNYIGTLAKVNGGVYSADVTGLAAADAASAGADSNVHAFTVSDTAANLGKYFDSLTTLADAAHTANDGTGVTDIAQTGAGDISITKTQYDAGTNSMALLTANSLSFAVTDVAVADAATVAGDTTNTVNKVSIKDTAANFAADLDDSGAQTTGNLTANVAKIDKVTLSDTNAFTITGYQYNGNTAVLAKIDGAYQATITSLAAGDVTAATGDANVVNFDVADTAANIGSNFSTLVANDKLTSIAQSDSDPVPLALADLVRDPAGYAATLQKFATPPSIALS